MFYEWWDKIPSSHPFPLEQHLLTESSSASSFGHVMEEVTGTEECAPGRANKQRCANLLKITQELWLLEGNTGTQLFTTIYHN